MACLLCDSDLSQAPALALGPLPPCNRFGEAGAERQPLTAVQCPHCALVQLAQLPPLDWLRPRHAWIRYNEPSAHLPAVAARLRAHCAPATRVLGVGPFEGPLHAALDWATERASVAAPGDGYLEAWQARLNAPGAGQAELVTCRYLLEHSHDPRAALRGLASLLAPDGRLYLEVPDSSKFLAAGDISFLWEEHSCYFTEATLRRLAAAAGLTVQALWRYPGALEDALCVLLAPGAATAAAEDPEEFSRFGAYRAAYPVQRAAYAQALAGQRCAVFGAGHQAILFIHAFGLSEQIAYVVDDAPDKAGSTIPGSTIPILPSASLAADSALDICLLAIGPAVIDKLAHVFDPLRARGVRVHTLFPGAGSGTLIDP
ncbi:methyltransferase domain-containing protein [Massilia sp. TS11]|uniref:methyltransferase domain-containing protein n=1 Tax=Massilia sp. TS11 TaxID=2908003 RepID=UPI001EDA6B02|nr:methyltransferase domain-containing protein [Massilia sp. TS11]MCG2586658.1 class I SAM-dependent methyltransferase [Massilia sp. TS11]